MATPPLALKTIKRIPSAIVYARPAPMLDTNEDAPGSFEAWEAVTPVRPDTPYVRALRFLDATGEALTAVMIIAGGVFAYNYMPPL